MTRATGWALAIGIVSTLLTAAAIRPNAEAVVAETSVWITLTRAENTRDSKPGPIAPPAAVHRLLDQPDAKARMADLIGQPWGPSLHVTTSGIFWIRLTAQAPDQQLALNLADAAAATFAEELSERASRHDGITATTRIVEKPSLINRTATPLAARIRRAVLLAGFGLSAMLLAFSVLIGRPRARRAQQSDIAALLSGQRTSRGNLVDGRMQ